MSGKPTKRKKDLCTAGRRPKREQGGCLSATTADDSAHPAAIGLSKLAACGSVTPSVLWKAVTSSLIKRRGRAVGGGCTIHTHTTNSDLAVTSSQQPTNETPGKLSSSKNGEAGSLEHTEGTPSTNRQPSSPGGITRREQGSAGAGLSPPQNQRSHLRCK